MQANVFPDFDKEVRRPYPVDEDCYDCAEFYDGCNARPSNPPTRCRDYLRLPDVMPGTYGQAFPPSRMGGRKEPRLCRTTAKDKPEPQPPQPTTPKRKRYMAAYMKRRRAESPKSHDVSDVPSTHAARPSTPRRIKNVNTPLCLVGVPRPAQTSILTNDVFQRRSGPWTSDED